MTQGRKEIVQFFQEDIQSANKEPDGDNLLSEYDDVIIIYYGHYPEYREDFDEILGKNVEFFDWGED